MRKITRQCVYLIAGFVFTLVLFNFPNSALNSVVFGYDGGGGGGGGGISFPSLTLPAGGFSIVINNGAAETESRNVTLTLNGGPDATRMVISNFSDFRGAQSKTYQAITTWVLSEGEGQKNIYVKFYNNWDKSSNAISDGINLVVPLPKSPLSSEAQRADVNKDNKINKYDFSLLMSNWGKTGTNICDFNNDGRVDKYDFALLMFYWNI